jgi:UDP-N-acetylmuramyl pentapeptide phosphotransferase/UDP-N-acetylglucosamine-1-phosphate transferase
MNSPIEKVFDGLFQKTLNELKTQLKFVGTFGFGITGLYGFVFNIIHHKYNGISQYEIILVFLALLSYFFISLVDDVKKIKQQINNYDTSGKVNYLSNRLTNIKLLKEKLIFVVNSFGELLGYIFVMIPIVEIFRKTILGEDLELYSLGLYLQSIFISLGIFYIKNVINNLLYDTKKKNTI